LECQEFSGTWPQVAITVYLLSFAFCTNPLVAAPRANK